MCGVRANLVYSLRACARVVEYIAAGQSICIAHAGRVRVEANFPMTLLTVKSYSRSLSLSLRVCILGNFSCLLKRPAAVGAMAR